MKRSTSLGLVSSIAAAALGLTACQAIADGHGRNRLPQLAAATPAAPSPPHNASPPCAVWEPTADRFTAAVDGGAVGPQSGDVSPSDPLNLPDVDPLFDPASDHHPSGQGNTTGDQNCHEG